MYNTDLERSAEAILSDLKSAATQNTANTGLKVSIVAVPLATLMVKLSQEAHQTADSARRFTKWLLGLTFALFFLTLALLFMQAYQIYKDYGVNHERYQGDTNT